MESGASIIGEVDHIWVLGEKLPQEVHLAQRRGHEQSLSPAILQHGRETQLDSFVDVHLGPLHNYVGRGGGGRDIEV